MQTVPYNELPYVDSSDVGKICLVRVGCASLTLGDTLGECLDAATNVVGEIRDPETGEYREIHAADVDDHTDLYYLKEGDLAAVIVGWPEISSDNAMLHKSVGISSDAAAWVEGPLAGDYLRVGAPEHWRVLIREADSNSAHCTKPTDPGSEGDWEWFSWDVVGKDGYLNGVQWLAARYVGD